MAKIKCETTRYDVVSRETQKPGVIIQRRWLRSERVGGRYLDSALRSELRDSHGRAVEQINGARFRDPASGEEYEVADFVRTQRAVMVAA